VLKRITATILDERRFVLDQNRRYYVLDGADELLAGQRQRWRDLQEGTFRPTAEYRPARQDAPKEAPAIETVVPAPETRPAPTDDRRRRSFGFGAPIHHRAPVETSTGQPSS
jgi:hypothetical protein